MIVRRANGRSDDERERETAKTEGKVEEEKEEEEENEEEKPTETTAAAVTSRLVFLITSDPGRAEEEEELLSDVSIMTRLCTERHVYIVYPARKTSTGVARGESRGRGSAARLRTRLGALPAQGAGWKP